MIDISLLKPRDVIQIRGIGKGTIINISDDNAYGRTAVQAELPNKKQIWIVPERIISRQENKNNFPDVVNGEFGVKPNTWSKQPITEKNKKSMIKITKQQLQEMITREAKRQMNESTSQEVYVKIDKDIQRVLNKITELKHTSTKDSALILTDILKFFYMNN